MASLESAEVYIPRDACVRSVRLQDLPLSVSRKMGVCLRAREQERSAWRSSPMATWICPVELRAGSAESRAAGRLPHSGLLPLEGQVRLPVVSASPTAHRLLQEALPCSDCSRSPAGLDGGGATLSCSRVPAGRKNAMILFEGQIFLSVRKKKNQNGRGIRDTIRHNGGADEPESEGGSQQEPIREAGDLSAACCVPGAETDEAEVTQTGVQQVACVSSTAVPRRLGGAGRQSAADLGDLEAGGGGASGSQVAMMGGKRSCGAEGEGGVRSLPAEGSRGQADRSQGAGWSHTVQVGEAVGGGALCSVTGALQDLCGRRLVAGGEREHHRVTPGSSTQIGALPPGPGHDLGEPPLARLSPAADIAGSSVFDELEQMERISRLRAALRVKEAELSKVTLK